jgi:alpha-amylase/alpha-mannosidase (GH57 family)
VRALVLHGHFYQPPREHPWLGVVEPERSAAPFRDWNARITAECYRPNAAARILDGGGRLRAVINTYEWTSFNFGPTLLAWLAAHAPDVIAALRRADASSWIRTGHGNAWAQAYGHPILPLSTARDVRTQILWGRRDFEHRFGRVPDGMWLPEMAVDGKSLAALAAAGIGLTLLAPHQARRIRPLGGDAGAWTPVTADTLDTRRLYRASLPGGGAVDVAFRDAGLSRDVAFGALLGDGAGLARRLRDAFAGAPDGTLLTVAVDGETYGHHHRFGEMALAFALRALQQDGELSLANPAAFRAAHPATYEVEIAENTSWSCGHGVERWRAGCGCRVGGPSDWSQAWRAPLRSAIDWLREELALVYEARAADLLRDAWGARDRYVECLLAPERMEGWLTAEARAPLSPAQTVEARRLLELARNALLMQTSCGWFFDELTGIEPVQVLRYAARAVELAEQFGWRREPELIARVEPARSNLPGGETGATLYRRTARGAAATPTRVAATAALLAAVGEPPDVPGFELSRANGETSVRERATGSTVTVSVETRTDADGTPSCIVAGETYGLDALFGVQRERVADGLARRIAADALDALGRVDALLAPLLADGVGLPPALAALLGWRGADRIAAALDAGDSLAGVVEAAAALRRQGATFPGQFLGPRLAGALEARLARLPHAAGEAIAILDLVKTTEVRVDIAPAQIRALLWWRAARPSPKPGEALAVLRDRLAIAPEEP